MQAVFDRHEETYRRVWEETRKVVRYLREADAPIPEVLRIIAKHVLEGQLVAELRRAADATPLPAPLFEVSEEARSLGLKLEATAARPIISRAVGQALDALSERPTPDRVASFEALVLGLERLGLHFELWQTQNRFFALWRDHPEARETLRPLAGALGFALAAEETR
jgi:hypothetical protein